jgi:hypothetical protein
MAIERGITTPKKGMNRSSAPFEIGESEYTFAFNANFSDAHGNGQVNLQNESSNIYCSGFKDGYKVVGHRYHINKDRVYFFLTNPETGCSEIGFIRGIKNTTSIEALSEECGCNIKVIMETPLQDISKITTCTYTTIISDYCEETESCTGCLNFSIDHPIHESNILIKDEITGTTMYWTDGNEPQRYIQLDNLGIYVTNNDDCTDEEVTTCLQCDKLRIFPLSNKMCVTPMTIQGGGNLKAGMYEVLAAYCDKKGNELTNYYSKTNLIPIHDPNNNILDQTNLDYTTNFAIGLEIDDIDPFYEYYKVAVIYKSGLDATVTVFENGVYPKGNKRVSVVTLVDKPTIPIDDILRRRVAYTKARGMAEANGYAFQYGVEEHRTINLQPVVSPMGAFVKWSTVQAKESLYNDGIGVSKYLSYMRDEVVPLSIKFFMDGGHETDNFVFVPRPPSEREMEVLGTVDFPTDKNTDSIERYSPECSDNIRNKRWQYENTATVLGDCLDEFSGGTIEVERVETTSCLVRDAEGEIQAVIAIASGEIIIEGVTDIVAYINSHLSEIMVSTDPQWDEIKNILNDPDAYQGDCDPDLPENCTPWVEVSSEILALAVSSQTVESSPVPYDSQTRVHYPTSCAVFVSPEEQDEDFVDSYMLPTKSVKKRNNFYTNIDCPIATDIPLYISPFIDNSFYLQNQGSATGLSALLTAYTSSSTSANYANKVHTNALWYKVDLTSPVTYVEVSDTPNLFPDDNTGNSIRITVFDGCTLTDEVAYTRIVTDVTEASDLNKYLELELADFTGTQAIIAIDSPYIETVLVRVQMIFDGPLKIIIGGTPYPVTYSISPATTAINFVATHAATILGAEGLEIASDGDYVVILTTTADLSDITFESGLATYIIQNVTVHRLTPPSGCINIFKKDILSLSTIVFEDLTFAKKITYESTCTYEVPQLGTCDAVPHKFGLFSYWESALKYPCTPELYDSSTLNIEEDDIPDGMKEEFEEYFSDGVVSGVYTLKDSMDLRDKPIRHYKFPCNRVVPFITTIHKDITENIIHPIGFSLDTEVVRTFLDIAVKNNLITLEERGRINKYEIYRGDRSVDQSIIAKGLLFDVYKYNDTIGGEIEYSNYPLNALGPDIMNDNVPHPFGSFSNNAFTFHSPDTSFYKPTLPPEVNIEGYLLGNSATYSDIVKDHPTYVILADGAYSLATSLAIAEIAFEMLMEGIRYGMDAATAGTLPGIPAAALILVGAIIAIATGLFRVGRLRYEWIETIRNLGHPESHAYYNATIGFYNSFLPNTVLNSQIRGISMKSYIHDGRWEVTEESTSNTVNVNNFGRESSVYLNFGTDGLFNIDYPADYVNYDTKTFGTSDSSVQLWSGKGASPKMTGKAASPYVSLKRYLPEQYGSISSVKWLSTGYCGDVNKIIGCDPIFGGDTYISRFAPKRKFPFFTNDAFGMAPLTPFRYSDYFNVNPDSNIIRGYLDYLINRDDDDYSIGGFVFPTNRSRYNLYFMGIEDTKIYLKPPSKFFIYSYGFPYFITESVFNGNYRYAKRELHENFYPNIKDVIRFTQEKNVSIREPNVYLYNFVYSTLPTHLPSTILPEDYNRGMYDKLRDTFNTAIYSGQDITENSLTNPWLRYKALDVHTFPTSQGKLIDMDGIGSEQVLARFEHGITIFGAIDVLRDRLTPEQAALGIGGIFSGRNINFNKTDLGFAGTQHVAKVSCEFGNFWADAKRGEVFQLDPTGQALDPIMDGMEHWFKEHLPFKILADFPDIPYNELDNSFKGLGLTMGWDSRTKRVFLTKLDYKKVSGIDLTYRAGRFYIPPTPIQNETEVFLYQEEYFENCSWTIAYSPLTKMWISYYGFHPNYYIGYENYFQTGKNYASDSNEIGLWSHLPFISSYQVFYGKLQPFIIEYALPSKGLKSTLHDVKYALEVKKYYNKYDVADVKDVGYNKVSIYNNSQNTGQLNLIPRKVNNLAQETMYPKHNPASIDILQTEEAGYYSFNHIYNAVKVDGAGGIPIWLNDANEIHKTLNQSVLNMRSQYKDRLQGDYFMVRLQQDIESRYKMIHRFSINKRDFR